jgi:hypothetical protein
MKTKFKNWKTVKSLRDAEKLTTLLQEKYPELLFRVKTNSWKGKDKKTYSVQNIVRKGCKRDLTYLGPIQDKLTEALGRGPSTDELVEAAGIPLRALKKFFARKELFASIA